MRKGKVGILVGTRPGVIKHAPVIRELRRSKVPFFVVHAGQHYSYEMDRVFFKDLELPYPKFVLRSVKKFKTPGHQTAEMLKGIEKILLSEKPRAFLVGGDTNANLAGALACRKLHIPLGHIEAGCRSYDRRMPEEHNRVMIDHISDWLFAPSGEARGNLSREAVRGNAVVVGSSIVDAVKEHRGLAAKKSRIRAKFGLKPKSYVVLTAHREQNVDSKKSLEKLLELAARIKTETGLWAVFPVHPRTRKRAIQFKLSLPGKKQGVIVMKPLGYLDFLSLVSGAAAVFTDSGGLQQEACILGVPCITLRENTEWKETLKSGANALAGTEPEKALACLRRALRNGKKWMSPFKPGASKKIVRFVKKECFS